MTEKYFRTYHAPWSAGITSDDKVHTSMSQFYEKMVIATEKRDGQNTSMTNKQVWARSLDSTGGVLMTRIKRLHANISHLIPDGMKICGENMQYVHSIAYSGITTFQVFSIWQDGIRLNYTDMIEWCELLGLEFVPLLYRGVYDEQQIKNLKLDFAKQEGYVISLEDSFSWCDASKYHAKYVRANHVQTDTHWQHNLRENAVV